MHKLSYDDGLYLQAIKIESIFMRYTLLASLPTRGYRKPGNKPLLPSVLVVLDHPSVLAHPVANKEAVL